MQSLSKPRPISVILLEDHQAIREMIATFIQSVPGFVLQGDYGDARSALQACQEGKPDLLIADLMMNGFTGLDLLTELHRAGALPRTLVFTANTSQLAIERALSLGVLGYIEKTASFAEFKKAMMAVSEGRPHLGPKTLIQTRQIVARGGRTALSPREQSILKLIAEGQSSKSIADILKISQGTVESHRGNISRRTGLHSVAEFTLLAIELGLIEAPQRLQSS